MRDIRHLIAEVLDETAQHLLAPHSEPAIKIGLTAIGNEHGYSEVLSGAEMAQRNVPGIEVLTIGPADMATNLRTVPASTEEEAHAVMERMLDAGELQAAVTMHYPFPLGVATVGLVSTPGLGRPMFIACTTGMSSAERVQGMAYNALYGISVAKAYGIANPSVGVLNIDGARPVERILRELQANGYCINLAVSGRSDRDVVMRGNDLLRGTPDVMVCDSLTGNLLTKLFSAFTTGGGYESVGWGYGPGIGERYQRIIHIISRASGAPVIAGSISYAAAMVRGKVTEVFREEWQRAHRAGLSTLCKTRKRATAPQAPAPEKKVVTEQIAGIDVLLLESAQELLRSRGIYAETGMGCVGPVILVALEDRPLALDVLQKNSMLTL
ncbi:glycine/sarcosine/betaine reductase complex component C subunit alpha [Desulfomonile tiedjei]|uniref:Fatty acid/phospholipid biosynthesis enzyme n=1 Tax=Desulfomonile tiedjei (strain ATCC 49306 / DSM 6799 / DCB-1) TaxID=706587 RepID=I4CBS1_DESTA|nr:glycine/sarcosine/betaine reductase complex component C subunit alpha [Desulfomonile tiedjei]AFM27012.1 fatty acid/phospholipid biosynthesis enzyme [Desulfomonile tiedjei DSM 6799]